MADDNRSLKYIRYAIGEIVLVVVGILIALSINNWNAERKQAMRKKEVIESLTIELSEVRNYSKDQVDMMNERIGLFNKILNEWETFDPNLLPNDSLNRYYWFIHTQTLLKYNPRNGFYNSLISSGEINLIQDSTVVKLNSVYDSHRKDVVTYVNQEADLHILIANVVAKNHSKVFLSGRVVEASNYFQFMDTSTTINFLNSIKSDGELKSLIFRNLFIIKMKMFLLRDRLIPELNKLIESFENTDNHN